VCGCPIPICRAEVCAVPDCDAIIRRPDRGAAERWCLEVIHLDLLSPLLILTLSLNLDAGIPRDSKCKPGLQILASVYGNRDDLLLPLFGVDMVTSVDALERPAVCFNQPAHFRPGDRFQTATSRI